LKVSTGEAFGTSIIRIEGDVEPEDAPDLERAAWDAFGARGTQIVLDLERCTLLSSTGLGVLFSLVRWVRPKGGKVIAIRPSPQIVRVLRLVGLTDESSFLVLGDMDDAKRFIAPTDIDG
jgi:anti-anti-sigma factor